MDRYVNTTKAIKEHIGRSYTNGGDAQSSLDVMALTTIIPPIDPVSNYQDIMDIVYNTKVVLTARD